MIFSKFTKWYKSPCHLVLEHFHHPKEILLYYGWLISVPTQRVLGRIKCITMREALRTVLTES